MTDPFPTSPVPEPHDADADRAARIEALLVAGLDHYFAAEYEQAINVWTRVVFLDRHDDRARAIRQPDGQLGQRQRHQHKDQGRNSPDDQGLREGIPIPSHPRAARSIPNLLVIIFGVAFGFYRRRKYAL